MKITIDFDIWQTQKDFCKDHNIKQNSLCMMIARKHHTIKTKLIPQLNNIILIRKIK